MKADLTRDTFDQALHFSHVLVQQGRVQLDADFNEQSSILLHYLRTVVAGLLGPSATPTTGGGFRLETPPNLAVDDFSISAGRIYVDGILVENDRPEVTYLHQPDLPNPDLLKTGTTYLAYLDVWERLVSALEAPRIRETALGGPDTAVRSKVVWQVRTVDPEVARKGALDAHNTAARRISSIGSRCIRGETPRRRPSSGPATVVDANGQEVPLALPPRGIEHYYAPLGVLTFDGQHVQISDSCRCDFDPLKCLAQAEARKRRLSKRSGGSKRRRL